MHDPDVQPDRLQDSAACGWQLVAGARYCHQCGRRVAGTGRVLSARLRAAGIAARVFLILAATTALVALALLTFRDVAPVVGTGPVLAVFAALSLCFGIVNRWPWTVAISIAHLGICGLFFGLVITLEWSPRQAEMPFITMGSAHLMLTIALTWLALARERPRPRHPLACPACAYLLYGTSGESCPECGEPVPERIRRARAVSDTQPH